ncbi:hypothetical protein BG011_004573 [Mortierella polycephala]|uniref:F-box domain-containing protein n=1 Tax=Mortierella polycephala TaxID=41804 RepID=A0A9P6U271_9FUNG|nr:hypothetical protein BG011_004573 [Mortierella polycephala]
MTLSIFDIPYIQEDIAQYLLRQDLAHCVLVSKPWHGWFAPSLWQSLDETAIRTPIALSTLQKYQAHVRSLKARPHWLAYVADQTQIQFTNLQTLTMSSDAEISLELEQRALGFIERYSAVLRTLRLCISHKRSRIKGGLDSMEALVNCLRIPFPRLTELDLIYQRIRHESSIMTLITICCQHPLESFRFRVRGDQGPRLLGFFDALYENRATPDTVWFDQKPMTRIRNLYIEMPNSIQENQLLIPLLKKCPLLQRLEFSAIHSQETIAAMTTMLKDKSLFPGLRHIYIGGLGRGFMRNVDDALACLLFECGDGMQLEPSMSNQGHVSGQGLRWRERDQMDEVMETRPALLSFGTDPTCNTPLTYAALRQHHAHTLSYLDLTRGFLDIYAFANLMATLEGLKAAKVWVVLFDSKSGLVDLNEFGLGKTLQNQWVCKDLRKLEVFFERASNTGGSVPFQPGDGTLQDVFLEYAFTRIGSMTALEELVYEGWFRILRLNGGYLDRLRNLKRLKELDLVKESIVFGVKEAEWILEHWSRLTQIRGQRLPAMTRSFFIPSLRPETVPNVKEAKALLVSRRPLIFS